MWHTLFERRSQLTMWHTLFERRSQLTIVRSFSYINDLSDTIPPTVKCFLYADDSECYFNRSSCTDCKAMERALQNFCNWSDLWQLRIAYPKCNTISFGNMNIPDHQYFLHNHELEMATTT